MRLGSLLFGIDGGEGREHDGSDEQQGLVISRSKNAQKDAASLPRVATSPAANAAVVVVMGVLKMIISL